MGKGRKVMYSSDEEEDERVLHELHVASLKHINELLSDYEASMIAATMMANAIRLYKKCLNSDEAFKDMMETIFNDLDAVKEFEEPTIQ